MKTIYGGEPKNPPAFCRKHCGYVTVTEMKRHECLKKQCRHLCKYDHPYWQQRENLKKKKQAGKAAFEEKVQAATHVKTIIKEED